MTPVADLSNPEAGSALVDALRWIEGVMLGPIAMTMAVAGVAFVGILLLQGRIAWRRGLAVIVGCFIVFGAQPIVYTVGIDALPSDIAIRAEWVVAPDVPQGLAPQAYDPYAGASFGN